MNRSNTKLYVEGAPKKVEWPKILLLIKNPQLLSNLYETLRKYSSQKYFMLLELQPDCIKIVEFLLIANFWAFLLFFYSPSMYKSLEIFQDFLYMVFYCEKNAFALKNQK